MGLDGNEMLRSLKHLSEVERMKQVVPLSYALFPGYHCPLMGAMLTIKEIDSSVMVVLGPDECAYYTKMATDGTGMAADGCQIVSIVLDQHDVTFGCQKKLEAAFAELAKEYNPKAVFLVTTCVPEVTGDDVDSLADNLIEEYEFPILVFHAENFKTDDHLPGIEHTMSECIHLMEAQECDGSVNVLGLRLGDFRRTETAQILRECNVPIGMLLPGKTSVEEIRRAPEAKVNLVVHPVGLPLAKKMKEKFGIPYVDFQRFSEPKTILACYQSLFQCLEQPMPEKIRTMYEAAEKRTENARPLLAGGRYISGNTALCNYEMHSFLHRRLGLTAQLLQISDLDEDGLVWRKDILQYADPYVTRAANIGALQYLYPVLKPDYNLGAGAAREMIKSGTVPVQMMQAYNTLGFEVNEMVVNAFLQACHRKEEMFEGMPGMPRGMSRMIAGRMPKGMSGVVPGKMPQEMMGAMSGKMPQEMMERMPGKMPEKGGQL